jgi:glutamate/tyrosine decarboxylase-like PLP-dependent enzyme
MTTAPQTPEGVTDPARAMYRLDPAMLEMIFSYCRARLAADPVPLDLPGDKARLEAALDGLIRPEGRSPESVLNLFATELAPAVISIDSPRFLSFIPAAPTKASLLFDMVVSCSSLQGTSWLEAAGAIAAENQTLRVLADLAGLPPEAGGCFVSGGSAGNLSALAVARDTAGRRASAPPRRGRVAVSDEVHASVTNALRLLGLDTLLVEADDHRLTGSGLAAALEADRSPGEVVAVVATAGTTNAGIVDDLAGIASVAGKWGLWFHVDAAYGGAGLFSPRVRDRYRGIEAADSLVVDPHKWLFAPFDCAALIYRRPALAKAVHTQQASYLEVTHRDDTEWDRSDHDGATYDEPFNPSDYAFHLTRRARGLPLWFSLAVHGTEAYREAVEAGLAIAQVAASEIRRRPYLKLLREPELSIVIYERLGWTWAEYESWTQRLLAEQIGFVTPSRWEGRPIARLAFLHPGTTPEVVREILDTMA